MTSEMKKIYKKNNIWLFIFKSLINIAGKRLE